ncbi:unnamed protein product, partial [Laminaria digitata]
KVLVDKVNEDLDIPWTSESREERMIDKIVDKVAPKVEPALLAILPAVYVTCIKLALDEAVPIDERKDRISDMLRAELSDPLTRELNERIDMSLIPENIEGVVLKVVSNKVISAFVEWTVGQVTEQLA